MAKKNMNTEGKTCEQMKAELKTVVDSHNASEDLASRQVLAIKAFKLKDDYNKVSLLDVYAECMEAENPMLAFIKAYTYPTLSVSAKKDTGALTMKDDGASVMNLWNFVEWAEARNKSVTVGLDWKSKASDARKFLLEALEKYVNDSTEKDVGGLKTAMQTMFDAIVSNPGQSGKNSIVFTSKAARIIFTSSGQNLLKLKQVNYASSKAWQGQVLMFLHTAAEGKEPTLVYGDPEDQKVAEAVAEAEAETTTEEAQA